MSEIKHIEVNGTTYDIADEEARTNATEAKSTAEEAQSTAAEALEKAEENDVIIKAEPQNNSHRVLLSYQKGEEDPENIGYIGNLSNVSIYLNDDRYLTVSNVYIDVETGENDKITTTLSSVRIPDFNVYYSGDATLSFEYSA